MLMETVIRPMEATDWPEVRRIYLEGIATGNATFETDAPGWEQWDRNHLQACRYVAQLGDALAGWVMLSAVSGRCVYGGVAELSVYVSAAARGRGIGAALMRKLVEGSEALGQAGIFPENRSSIALHTRAGFREVGRRERIGKLGTRWRDVLLMERRSPVVQ
jgi:L-amino acid N-acyltransferase YncA